MNMEKLQILSISKTREDLIQKREASWNEEKFDYEEPYEKEIDDLGNQIFDYLKKYRQFLPFEFIFEELTKLGHSPNLLYDDNGHFAMVSDGYQSISEEIADTEMAFLVTKRYWKNSVKEALDFYLDDNELENIEK